MTFRNLTEYETKEPPNKVVPSALYCAMTTNLWLLVAVCFNLSE